MTDRTVNAVVMAALPVILVASEFLMLELGHRLGLRIQSRLAPPTVGSVTSTVLALMGLVLAFSFSNAATRLDAARQTILNEASAADTAWARVDLASADKQAELRDLMRKYVDSRLGAYASLQDRAAYDRHVAQGAVLMARMWTAAVASTEQTPTPNRTLLLTAVNALSGATAARTLSLGTHLPDPVLIFLFGIVFVGTFLTGLSLATPEGRPWLYWGVIATVLSSILYAIMDMEFPRLVAFNLLEKADAMLIDLRKTMR